MCKLVGVLASTCRHPLSYHYDHCSLAQYPYRCNYKSSCIDSYSIENTRPLCEPCWKENEAKLYSEYYEERRELTKKMRAEQLDDEEISLVRKYFRDQFYERFQNANKPLPALPDGFSASSAASSVTAVAELEKGLHAKGLYMLGGNPPMEIRREENLMIKVDREEFPRGPI